MTSNRERQMNAVVMHASGPPAQALIFDQLAVLFDRGLLTPRATKTWPLENSAEAYQRVQDGAHGIKQVLLPIGGGA
jgi:Zinc-binding dehydrogenase